MKPLDMFTETLIRHQHEATARHVEHQQLAHEALANPHPTSVNRFYQPALVLVGKRLVVWGMRLQRLYPEPVAVANPEVTLAAQNK